MRRFYLDGAVVGLEAVAVSPTAACPGCGRRSDRVHGRYQRQLMDAPVGGRQVRLLLVVRRFFCDNVACAKKAYAEQVDGLTVRFGRQTALARAMLQAIALAGGGRPASVWRAGWRCR